MLFVLEKTPQKSTYIDISLAQKDQPSTLHPETSTRKDDATRMRHSCHWQQN